MELTTNTGILAVAPGADERGRAARLASLLETASQPFVGLSLDGRVACANLAFAALTGRPLSNLVGRDWDDLCTEPTRAAASEARARVAAGGEPAQVECGLLRPDGRVVPIALALELDRDDRREPVGLFAFVHDLTERKRVEAALRESEEEFRRLYDEAPVGYHEVDCDGRIVSINRTECELLGYSREELIGRPVFDLIAEEARETARRNFPAKVAGLRPLAVIERPVVCRDGRRMVASIDERFKRDAAGRVVGLRSVMRDVTDQKRAESALVASERRARALFDGMNEAAFVHAFDGRILDANPAASRLLGYTHDELLALTTADIDDPTFAAGFDDRLNLQMARGHLSCEGRHRTKDGVVIPVEVTTSTIQLDDRPAVLAVIRDISERLALEETRRQFADAQERNARAMAEKNAELTRSEARYRQFTEGCLDGVLVADGRGRVTLINPAAERMFDYPPGAAVGLGLADLMPGAFDPPAAPGAAPVGPPRWSRFVGTTVELTARRRGGEEFPVELSLNAAEQGGEVQLLGSLRDQTERHRMQAMLAQSDKLASIGLLSAGVAHEINNPLAYVGNNLAVLEREFAGVMRLVAAFEGAPPADPAAAAQVREVYDDVDWAYVRDNLPRMLARTREGVQRVANIVGNMRTLARTTPLKMEPASIPDLFDGALEMLRGRLRRGQIEVDVRHGAVPPLVCVPSQISQVLLNLLINATQAVESAGRGGAGWIRFASEVDGDWVLITLADNGGGIAPENIPRLFDPFFTTKGVGEGTGLGLAICHGLVTGHGGRIDVESRAGEGTTFRIRLPLKRA